MSDQITIGSAYTRGCFFLLRFVDQIASQMYVRLEMSLLKTVKLNRLMIVNVGSSDEDETRQVYSPASSSETSDKIKDQVHAYLERQSIRMQCVVTTSTMNNIRMFEKEFSLIITDSIFIDFFY